MDLKDGKITIGELERRPEVAALLNRIAPRYRSHPLAPVLRLMSLNQAVRFAKQRGIPQELIDKGLAKLRSL